MTPIKLTPFAALTAAALATIATAADAQTQDAIVVLQLAETAYHASETIRAIPQN